MFSGITREIGKQLIWSLNRLRVLSLVRAITLFDSASELIRNWGWDPNSPTFDADLGVHRVAANWRTLVQQLGFSRARVLQGLGAYRCVVMMVVWCGV